MYVELILRWILGLVEAYTKSFEAKPRWNPTSHRSSFVKPSQT